MIDRINRDRLVESINRYLEEDLTAFEFDDQINQIMRESTDPTVQYIGNDLWNFYDDCKNHKVILSKEAWDYFQRLVLILRSDSHVKIIIQRKWSIRQIIAALSLLTFVYCVTWVGMGYHILVIAMPFGAISIMLSHWHRFRNPVKTNEELARVPFSTVSELRTTYRKVHGFCKKQYPRYLESRIIRSAIEDFVGYIMMYVLWLIFSPVVLFMQLFPEKEYETRVQA